MIRHLLGWGSYLGDVGPIGRGLGEGHHMRFVMIRSITDVPSRVNRLLRVERTKGYDGPVISLIALVVLSLARGIAAAPPGAEVLGANDLSILMPLPDSASGDLLLRASDRGSFGELLPRELFEKLPALHPGQGRGLYSALRAVGIRLDPCFPAEPPGVGCAPQVRLIWQPVVAARGGGMTTLDAAAHTFYALDRPAFGRILERLSALNERFPAGPDRSLSVNPRLRRHGLAGDYGRRLLDDLKEELGEQRLVRITFAQRVDDGRIWVLGGLEVVDGAIRRLPIPRIEGVFQAFVNQSRDAGSFAGGMSPRPRGDEALALLLVDSERAGADVIARAGHDIAATEDPLRRNVHTVDCVSCHVAQPARAWMSRRVSEARPSAPALTLRAFGYDGKKPVINRRAVAETALSLRQARDWFAE